MSLKEHIERLLRQDYDETELYARLQALLTLWGGSAAGHQPSAHNPSGRADEGSANLAHGVGGHQAPPLFTSGRADEGSASLAGRIPGTRRRRDAPGGANRAGGFTPPSEYLMKGAPAGTGSRPTGQRSGSSGEVTS